MNTNTPYSDQWRERTRARIHDCGMPILEFCDRLGMEITDFTRVLFVFGEPVTIEVAAPFDELLARLDEQREAAGLAAMLDGCIAHHPGVGSVRVRRVDVDLAPLTDCDAVLHGHEPRRHDGDERRRWR